MKKYRYEIILFVVDAICMILELVASRVLSPYFGNSNVVWTSVIGIILLSSSIGNYIGGKIADNDHSEKNLKFILFCSAMLIFIIPIIQKGILEMLKMYEIDIRLGAIAATLLMFFIPSLFIGFINPIILKIKLSDINQIGKTAGRLTAIGTLGGIFGTFFGGFVLVPTIGSVYILFILTIVVVCLIPLVDLKIKDISNGFIVLVIIVCIICISIYTNINNENGQKILTNETSEKVSFATQYGRVLIYNEIRDQKPIRVLNIDSGFESATYTDENEIYELVFDYAEYYNIMFDINPEINNIMLIGGAGYSYPKYLISHYEDKTIDVVEIDEQITEIAKKYFYLDRLIEEYNLNENHRLNIIHEDGRVYLNYNQKKYDAILNDAFSGNTPVKILATLEANQKIKDSLTENGLYLTNIISSQEGNNSKFIKAEYNTLKQVFKNVYVIPCKNKNDKELLQNNMVIATDLELSLNDAVQLNISDDEIIITDDFCPVDTLIPVL